MTTNETCISSVAISGQTKIRVRLRGGRLIVGTYLSFDETSGLSELVMDNGTHQLRRVSTADIIEDDHSLITSSKSAQPLSAFSVLERFKFLEELTDLVIKKKVNSAVISGGGGLGKSYTVLQRLKFAGLIEHDRSDSGEGQYVVSKGFCTPKALYRCLYENNGKMIIFDDCDSVLENDSSLNILKGALDSYDKRVISWLTERPDDTLPQFFEFTGQVIFVTNKSIDEIAQPILSRCLFVDLTMTVDEKIERLEQLLPVIGRDITPDQQCECLDVISKNRASVKDLNIRTLQKVIQIRHSASDLADWKRLALYSIVTG